MKAVIFVSSNTQNIRGSQRLAHKAGLFCLHATGFHIPIKRRPAIITEPQREVMPAKVVCWTAVTGGPLFCPLTNVEHIHHAHRNSHTIRPAARQNPAGYSGTIPATRPQHAAATLRNSPGFFAQEKSAFGACETPIICYYSVY